MARSRRNKVFDLFKSNFQITFFYKPINENDFYYVVLDDVMKIQQEGREKRQAAEADMRRMENELKTKLLEIRR